jgi:hypothetical protein
MNNREIRIIKILAKDLQEGDVVVLDNGPSREVLNAYQQLDDFKANFGEQKELRNDYPILHSGLPTIHRDYAVAQHALDWSTDEWVAVRFLDLASSNPNEIEDYWVIYPKTWIIQVVESPPQSQAVESIQREVDDSLLHEHSWDG